MNYTAGKAKFCAAHALACAVKVNHKAIHRAHSLTHMAYLGCVAIFAHGPYAIAAGCLLVVTVVATLSGESVE